MILYNLKNKHSIGGEKPILCCLFCIFCRLETGYKWSEIFGAGKLPSPEEFIMIMNEKIIKL